MAKLPNKQGTFDEPKDVFTPVPLGKYVAQINKSDYKETNESKKRGEQAIQRDPYGGHSYYQQYDFTVLKGQHSGRIIFCRLHVKNRNQEMEEKENQRAHQLGRILGSPNFSDTEELHGIPLIIRVRITKPTKKYPFKGNDVNGFYPLDNSIETSSNISERSTNEPGEDWEDDEIISETTTGNKAEVINEDWEDQIGDEAIPFKDPPGDLQDEVSFDD